MAAKSILFLLYTINFFQARSRYLRPDFNQMIERTVELLEEYNITFEGSSRIFLDGSNPSFCRALKERLDEDPNYESVISHLKSASPSVYDLQFLQQSMFVIPIPFSKYHKDMLAHCKEFLEYHNGLTAIHPRHEKLITALRTAVENGEGILDKEATSHNDCLDAFRRSMFFWH